MDHNTIAKLMRKKTGSYFKLSMALFFFAVFVLASYVVYIQYQFQQAGQTVTDNSNSHMIEVQGRQRSGGYHDLECLRFQDKEVALEILNGLDGLDESAIVFSYMINFGFSDQNGQVYFLKGYGVPAVGKRFLLEDVGEGAAYCSPKKGKGDIELLVPEVKIEEAGCVGGKTRGFRLALKPLENKSVLFWDATDYDDVLYVNEQTFQSVVQAMYGKEWKDFMEGYDAGENFGIQAIDHMYIYVPDLDDLHTAAKRMQEGGYLVRYAMEPFDGLHHFISTNHILLMCLLSVAFLFTAFHVVNSFNNYIRSMQKDIGILRHWGYTQKEVFTVYSKIVAAPYLILSSILAVYVFVLAFCAFAKGRVFHILLSEGFLALLLSVMLLLIFRAIKKVCSSQVLYLLKESKEME